MTAQQPVANMVLEDSIATRIPIVGTNSEIIDDAGLTYNLKPNTLNVDGQIDVDDISPF